MNKNDVEKRLKELKIEDFIWVIYIGIIFFSWIANDLERKYFVNNDLLSKDKYRNIQTIIFSILLIVYIYFLYESIEDIKNIKDTDTEKKKILTYLSFIASLLITISGIIFLFITLSDEDVDIELAFS